MRSPIFSPSQSEAKHRLSTACLSSIWPAVFSDDQVSFLVWNLTCNGDRHSEIASFSSCDEMGNAITKAFKNFFKAENHKPIMMLSLWGLPNNEEDFEILLGAILDGTIPANQIEDKASDYYHRLNHTSELSDNAVLFHKKFLEAPSATPFEKDLGFHQAVLLEPIKELRASLITLFQIQTEQLRDPTKLIAILKQFDARLLKPNITKDNEPMNTLIMQFNLTQDIPLERFKVFFKEILQLRQAFKLEHIDIGGFFGSIDLSKALPEGLFFYSCPAASKESNQAIPAMISSRPHLKVKIHPALNTIPRTIAAPKTLFPRRASLPTNTAMSVDNHSVSNKLPSWAFTLQQNNRSDTVSCSLSLPPKEASEVKRSLSEGDVTNVTIDEELRLELHNLGL